MTTSTTPGTSAGNWTPSESRVEDPDGGSEVGGARDDEPGVGGPPWAARLVLAVGILAGFVYLGHKLRTQGWMVGLDFRVYRAAADAALSSGTIYGSSPIDIPGMTYRYPPVVLLAFLPSLLVPVQTGYVVHTLLEAVASLGLALLIVQYVTRRGVELTWIDRVLVAGFVFTSVHAMPSVVFGQVNHFVALGLAAGFVALDREAEAGAGGAFALAAVPKVFPAAVGLWLVRRRAYRAVATALATGGGLLALGLVAFGPRVTWRWFTEELLARMRPGLFEGGLPPGSHLVTLRRPLSVLFPTVDPALYGLGAALVLAPVLAYLLRDVDGRLARPIAVFATLAAILAYFPSSYLYVVYLYFPFVPLLYLFDGPGRWLFLAGGMLLNFPVQRNDLALALSKTPTGPAVDDVVLEVFGSALTVATPALVGIGLALAGCVRWTYRSD